MTAGIAAIEWYNGMARIWTDDEFVEVTNPTDVGELESAMRFKADHIKAKADPEIFKWVADALSGLWDCATQRVDVVRCKSCRWKDEFIEGVPVCNLMGLRVSSGFYCAYGKENNNAAD